MRSLAQLIALVTPKKQRVAWKRTPEEDARIYGPEDFRTWLHDQPCAVCGWKGKPEQMQQCHVKTGGTGRKDDWTRTFAGCGPHWQIDSAGGFEVIVEGCHHEQGRIGVKSFEKARGVNLLDLAAQTQCAWQLSLGNE